MRRLAQNTRFAFALIAGVTQLFAAGSLLYGAHTLFLRYYAREWRGIQISGVNGCQGEDMIANGDLFDGKTFCNQPENFVPWFEIYRRHWHAAVLYYGAALLGIVAIGIVLTLLQKRLASTTPFGSGAKVLSPADSEHLR